MRRVIGEDVSLALKLTDPLDPVTVDPGQIEQILMNLAVNARDAMPTGGRLTIETANVDFDEEYTEHHVGVSAGPHVMLAVTDTGIGMDESTKKRLFEPFFTTKEVGKGTGLGLATVYAIVEQSGGVIWVYSEPQMGATFKIYFPTSAERGVRSGPTAAPPVVGGSERLLLVEDQPEARAIACQMLRRHGYQVIEATNGLDALERARHEPGPLDLLITDVVMPGMGGRQLAERLHVDRPQLRVLFMSGYTDDTILRHGVLDAELAFVQKPFTTAAFLRKVREVLDAPAAPAR